MQLIYCVPAYFTSNNHIETAASEHTPRCLGQSYNSRSPVKTVNSQLGTRKYRGEVYGADSNALNEHYALDECSLWFRFS